MRHHMTADGPVPFTPEEEAARDAEEAAWLAAKSVTDHNKPILAEIQAEESASGFTRRQREFLIANSDAGSLKTALGAIDAAIAAKRTTLRT